MLSSRVSRSFLLIESVADLSDLTDLKQLLSIFTDAAAHVPRHRRISLFVRFVETLGAQEFLSAVAMLLVDKEVKVVDGSSLPLALFENFSVDIQLTVSRSAHQLDASTDLSSFTGLRSNQRRSQSPAGGREVVPGPSFVSLLPIFTIMGWLLTL